MILTRKNLIILFLFAILVFVGFWRLQYSPATWYDEGINAGIASSLVTDGVYSLKVGPDEFVQDRQFLITTNYPVLLPVALSLKIFGINFFAARLPMVVFLFLFAWTAYFLIDKWYGGKTAIMTLALVAVFLPFYGNGKPVLGEVPGLFFLLAGLFYLDSRKLWKLFLSGLFLGLSIATKSFFLLILPALFVAEVYRIFKKGSRKPLEYIILFVSILIPVFIWLWTINPNLSLNTIGSTVSYYSNSYADDTNIVQLILSNAKRFVTESTPLHFLALFIVSFFVVLKSAWKREVRMQEIVLITFIFLNILWYLKTPGWYRYFFPAHLLLFLLFPASLMKIFTKKFAIVIVMFFVIAQSFLLISKRNEPLYFASEVQDFTAYVQENTSDQDSIFVVNGPSVAFLLSDRSISQYVRINPELVFAPDKIKKYTENIDSMHVIVGALNEQDRAVKDVLDTNYKEIKAMGHYVLYKKL